MEYAYYFDPSKEPIKYINRGESVKIVLENAFGGQPSDEGELLGLMATEKHHPLTGPIYINGIEAGMNIEVQIINIEPEIVGYQCCSRSSGMLKIEPFYRNFKKIKVEGGIVNYNNIEMYAMPSVGVIGTATNLMTRSGRLDYCGGNIDLKELKVGSKIILPCEHKGALVYLGDMHLLQANGEISGIAAEVGGEVTFSIDISGFNYKFPIIITEDVYIIIGYGKDIEASIIQATNNAIVFLQEQYNLSYVDAYMILSLIGDISLGHSTGRIVSSGISMQKRQLEKMKENKEKRHENNE